MALDFTRLLSEALPPSLKGLPSVTPGFATRDVGTQGWNVLAGDLPIPVAVLTRPSIPRSPISRHFWHLRSIAS